MIKCEEVLANLQNISRNFRIQSSAYIQLENNSENYRKKLAKSTKSFVTSHCSFNEEKFLFLYFL